MKNTRLLILTAALTVTLSVCADDAPKPEQVERLVRDFAFATNTNLNRNTEFKIARLEVTRLWEELETQVYDVEYQIKDQSLRRFVGIYRNGKLDFLAPTLGGHGLMSGLVTNGEFYYTYSWGSGIHRSHVAKLQIVGDKLERSDSGGFGYQDLFVAADPSGKVRVLSGEFKEFNHWEAARDIGFVGKTHSSELQIVDANDKVITPTFPYRTEKSQPRGPANGSQPIRSETNSAPPAAGSRR